MSHLSHVIRRKVFWFLDYLRGSKTKSHLKEIRETLGNYNRPDVQNKRKLNMDSLLSHALQTTPFYKELDKNSSLEDFPVINKNTILERYDDFKSNKFRGVQLFKASSSGSTGIPFSIYQNQEKRARNTSDVIYFTEAAGGEIGSRLFYIKLWDHTNAKSKWETLVQNIVAHNVTDSSKADMASLFSRIQNHKSSKTVLGYPSFFEELCDYLDDKNPVTKPQHVDCIISMSEALRSRERQGMAHHFNAPVFERYSNQENGILAQQTADSNGRYVLNWASYYFEFLALDSDMHVNSGELGRLVVTDLFNFSMPMIRYDTGDMAIYEESKDGYPYLSRIYGRRMDTIYNTSGEIVSPFIFYMVLDYSKVRQFQFIQTGRMEYLFELNGRQEDVEEDKIVNYFRDYLGDNAQIEFSYVDEIPLLASGKRKKIVNRFHTESTSSS